LGEKYVWRLATGSTVRGSNPGGGEIFRNHPDLPWDTPNLYNGYRVSFAKSNWPGRGVDHTPPSSTEVKEYSFDISSENDVQFHRNFRGCVEISEKFTHLKYDENPSVYSQNCSMRTYSHKIQS